jgi:parallel beta-helix repeat protein
LRRAIVLVGTLLVLSACGGGGGGSATSRPDNFFVRADAGHDTNDGSSAGSALRTISAAVGRATDGDTIIVGPGVYEESVLDPPSGTAASPVTFLADSAGRMTGDPPGPVVVDAGGGPFAFRLTGASFTVIDGFTVTGAEGENAAGIFIRGESQQVTIRNCEISDSRDGIRVENSDDVLLFNNLIFANSNRGIRIAGNTAGSQRARVINNTVTDNGNNGFSLGTEGIPCGAVLRGNLIQNNEVRNIDVDGDSANGYAGDFNLVHPQTLAPVIQPGPHDVAADALLVDPGSGDYHLSQAGGGQTVTSPAVDAGDPGIDGDLLAILRLRTTASNGREDASLPDIGYHYAIASGQSGTTRTPTPRTTPTPTSIPSPQQDLFVRASMGSDEQDGLSPSSALRTLSEAASRMKPGDRAVVGPGLYEEAVIDPPGGTAAAPVIFLANPTGRETDDAPGSVIVAGGSGLAGFRLSRAEFVVIDGFEIQGGSEAGVQVRNRSHNVVIRNCRVAFSAGDGIRVQDSDGVLIFNNLLYANARRGILVGGTVTGSQRARLINNTVAANADRGVFIGSGSIASRDAELRNNILAFNGDSNVQVATGPPSSLDGYTAQYNLVFPETYVPGSLPRPTDLNLDPLFVDRSGEDFHLAQRGAGQTRESPAVNAADPLTGPEFAAFLHARSTASSGDPDGGILDMGYHD